MEIKPRSHTLKRVDHLLIKWNLHRLLPVKSVAFSWVTQTGELDDYKFAIIGTELQINYTATGTANADLQHNVEFLQFSAAAAIGIHELDDLVSNTPNNDYWLSNGYNYDNVWLR